jgi:hypothetical protein
VIGRTVLPNLYLNTGHGTLGWTMACDRAEYLLISFPVVHPTSKRTILDRQADSMMRRPRSLDKL